MVTVEVRHRCFFVVEMYQKDEPDAIFKLLQEKLPATIASALSTEGVEVRAESIVFQQMPANPKDNRGKNIQVTIIPDHESPQLQKELSSMRIPTVLEGIRNALDLNSWIFLSRSVKVVLPSGFTRKRAANAQPSTPCHC